MTLIELLLFMLIGTLIFLFLGLYFYFTLGNRQIRTLLIASVPFLNKGRVLMGNFHSSRRFFLELVPVNEGTLEKYPKSAGVEEYKKNREIEPGTHYTDPGSNKPIYFVTAGLGKTFDPVSQRSPSKVDNLIVSQSIETGKEIQKFLYGLEQPKKIKGPTMTAIAIVLILLGVGLLGMLFQINNNELQMIQALNNLSGQVSQLVTP